MFVGPMVTFGFKQPLVEVLTLTTLVNPYFLHVCGPVWSCDVEQPLVKINSSDSPNKSSGPNQLKKHNLLHHPTDPNNLFFSLS